jgi:hypothetical protein
MVQLRGLNQHTTTVYTDENGRYEFPKLLAGSYVLRIVRALEFKPYLKPSITLDGTAAKLDDIVLETVSNGEFVPANWDVAAQLAGAEVVWNLDGSAQEKRTFSYGCGSGCHTYGQILRNRFDEHGWRAIVTKMTHNTGSLLLFPAVPNRIPPEEQDIIVKWLTKVRGPDSKDMGYQLLPGPRGAATKAIVTEFELPLLLTAPHDVAPDSRGNVGSTATAPPDLQARSAHRHCRRLQGPPPPVPTRPALIPSTRTTWSGSRRTGRTNSGASIPSTRSSTMFSSRISGGR